MARVLIVDDEPHIVDVVRAYLAREGHDVRTAGDGPTALAAILDEAPDLVVLDVMLPGSSGFEVLRRMRAAGSDAAVVMLTARDDLVDRVAGLEIGADDYVTKPFEPRELVARVGAVLRRALGPSPAAGPRPRTLRLFDLAVDPAAREVRRGDAMIGLTRSEFDLLLALAADPGVALTRDQLGAKVFGEAFDAFDRTIDSHMKNLRHKLGPRPDGGPYVETVRGVGYRAARG
jgi:DNA-binding response OmpR family regulator